MWSKFVKNAIYSLKKQKIDWNYLYLSGEASCQKKNEEKIKKGTNGIISKFCFDM